MPTYGVQKIKFRQRNLLVDNVNNCSLVKCRLKVFFFSLFLSAVIGALRLRQKKLYASVVVSTVTVRVPNERPLAPNVTSVTSDIMR